MRETVIVLVRHPETRANVDGTFVGRGDSPYTHEGRKQLSRVPRKIALLEPDVVWSSPLRRAHRLAEKAASVSGVELKVDERLMELDFGAAEGMTFEEVSSAGMSFNYRSRDEPVAPGGESRGQIEARTTAFCEEIAATAGRHCIVTHGGVFRAALVHLLGLSSTDIWAFHIHNAQLAVVRIIDGHGMLESYVQG